MTTLTSSKTKLKKLKSHAFGRDVYFLGINKEGERLWLEKASWDCNWYWGFGYVETYNRINPEKATDIHCHTHYNLLLKNKHILSDLGINSPLTEKEQWELSDLMKSFYTLGETAELFGGGGSNISSTDYDFLKNKDIVEKINKELLPKLFKEIYKLLED